MANSYKVIFEKPGSAYYDIMGETFEIANIDTAQWLKVLHNMYLQPVDGMCTCVPKDIKVKTRGEHSVVSWNPLDISNSYTMVFDSVRGRSKKSPCENVVPLPGHRKLTPLEKCVANLTTGKCKCPFMADVVGAVILPEFYAKQK